MDHVGVKAPGRPRMIIFLLAPSSFNAIFFGGKPCINSRPGRLSPTEANPRQDTEQSAEFPRRNILFDKRRDEIMARGITTVLSHFSRIKLLLWTLW